MPLFKLVLQFWPSFHRQCSIEIEGELTGGVATFEARATGLLQRNVLPLAVEAEGMQALHGCCSSMLAAWDPRWRQSGLDGISIDGIFDSAESDAQAFSLWSPKRGSPGYAMIAAALDCFPVEDCTGVAGELLEIVRDYFDLQPSVTVINQVPLRLRFAPSVNAKDAVEIERSLRELPDDVELIVDVSGMEHLVYALARIAPIAVLLKRPGVVRWIVREVDANVLIARGVQPSAIETVQCLPISPRGEPILLGGLFISSPELIALANAGARIELVRAIRQEYGLTVEQSAKAAGELIEILVASPSSDGSPLSG